ncbi:Murein DD-endopeptidase MepM and murein hydrolase activator NlpD, contain LysM domain [Actinokineospora alba]|uniref:Murein DD-endopeptidase MepM and murein hydrolase activator NlpD, contain LysM domain n=1 Tax=Actinokineospora alba TaxID=504798 RepID=A0A1H0WJG9_9PSEU|nr:M23 family metallopeptidase [Actinokineospora alba]TDP65407.1 murein DD-endopeptidase MepM/ murein hydrolase activator NlpD [Actinokineospora alba]SDH61592.1 Murein DD-endopeptidase MepM and murein hydrolase activator NlpD, contain LysM domain [Actinokineospora alba]SDP90882.1 Murein DD-endopeptidase MepM and murein hydrolase activator NlpD, contain LysM domain [Actinokineospora alba]
MLRGRVVVAAVAVGAFAAAAAGQTLQSAAGSSSDDIVPLAGTRDASSHMGGMGGDGPIAPELLTLAKTSDGTLEAQKMASSERVTQARNARAAEVQKQKEEAARPKAFKPTVGRLTSGFGARWGTTHYGIDIANRIGTPIVSVADGTVIEAGSASGFGLWVRVQHADGTVTVYGHVNDYVVREGQRVKAGQLIAHMGNRGQSTGPHLHFEVWDASGRKMNPLPWLTARGISL